MNNREGNAVREFRSSEARLPGRIFRLFGITESRGGLKFACFGPWLLTITLDNAITAHRTGPYMYLKTIGPTHLSLSDHGPAFATNGRQGSCLQFRDPVPALDPFGLIRHPDPTVTIADPAGLIDIMKGRATIPEVPRRVWW